MRMWTNVHERNETNRMPHLWRDKHHCKRGIRMDGDPTVLGMINKNLDDISKDVKEIKKDMKAGAVMMENHSGRISHIEEDVKELSSGQKKIKETVYNHATDKNLHYNQGYEETFTEKAWRKKGEIIFSAILGSITGLIAYLKSTGVI